HLLRTSRASVLLDCGLFQGRRRESFTQNRDLPVDTRALDAVVLSHAHIDHSGALPVLCREGFRGPIYATPATRDLAAPMLPDSALIQASEDRKSTRLNSSHVAISYAVFCLKKKKHEVLLLCIVA